ncbi:alpha/beta hydrolase [Striga asiatica]|uniref:Alpha/beta hydrolase n=1 Tax=Striga asiatica TaxID=4170 RepID=A0A5A7Q0D9_STRAF|nr:alpha/beta hydrolase [Striga asiatica]
MAVLNSNENRGAIIRPTSGTGLSLKVPTLSPSVFYPNRERTQSSIENLWRYKYLDWECSHSQNIGTSSRKKFPLGGKSGFWVHRRYRLQCHGVSKYKKGNRKIPNDQSHASTSRRWDRNLGAKSEEGENGILFCLRTSGSWPKLELRGLPGLEMTLGSETSRKTDSAWKIPLGRKRIG